MSHIQWGCEPKCPYCACDLGKYPARKKKCSNCGEIIYPRNDPESKKRMLVTQHRADEIEAYWSEKYPPSPPRDEEAIYQEGLIREKERMVKYEEIRDFCQGVELMVIHDNLTCERCEAAEREYTWSEIDAGLMPDVPLHMGCRCTTVIGGDR